jgi:hypothetical protein
VHPAMCMKTNGGKRHCRLSQNVSGNKGVRQWTL